MGSIRESGIQQIAVQTLIPQLSIETLRRARSASVVPAGMNEVNLLLSSHQLRKWRLVSSGNIVTADGAVFFLDMQSASSYRVTLRLPRFPWWYSILFIAYTSVLLWVWMNVRVRATAKV